MRLIRFEWAALWRTGGLRGVLIAALVLMLAMGGLYAFVPVEGEIPRLASAVEGISFWGLALVSIVLIATVSRGRRGVTASSLLTEPRREVMLRARLGLVGGVTLVLIFLSTAVGAASLLTLQSRGFDVAFDWDRLTTLWVSLLVSAAVAVACGLLLPSPATAYPVFVAVIFLGDFLISPLGRVGELLSLNQIADYWSTSGGESSLLGVTLAALVWIALPMGVGAWVFLRCDIKVSD